MRTTWKRSTDNPPQHRQTHRLTRAIATSLLSIGMLAGLALIASPAGAIGVPGSGVTYTPTNCNWGTQAQDCPTTTPLMSTSPSSFQFGTIANNGGSSTASVTFTNTSGQTEVFSTGGYNANGAGDTVTPTGCGNANLSYTTLSAGQSCTVTVTLHIVDGLANYTVSPSNTNQEDLFATIEDVNIQGDTTGNAFYVPFYAVLAPPTNQCPTGDTGTYPSCVPPPTPTCPTGDTGTYPSCVPPPSAVIPAPVVGMTSTPHGNGYWLVDAAGYGAAYGSAQFYGGMGGQHLNAPISHIVATADGKGYWMVAADGGVFAFGDAPFYGSMGGHPLNAPVVDMATTPGGHGYWMAATDGGIFAFGSAQFYGSMGGQHLNKPVNGITAAADGHGYRMVASDGGIFSFGSAVFYGSLGGNPPSSPVVGMASTSTSQGYWMVTSNGDIFPFGNAQSDGSASGISAAPIMGMAADPATGGYWEVSSSGGVFSFGAPYYGG